MRVRPIVLAMLAMGLAACAPFEIPHLSGSQPTLYPPNVFDHRVANSELVLFWNCVRPDPNVLRLNGVAQSPWSAQPIRSLEFELVGVDEREHMVSQTKGTVRDSMIYTNQISPFQLDLRTVGSEARFDLFYQYLFLEGEEKDALLSGPPVEGLRLFAQTNRFLARDVCSETKHRVR